jgi:predicted porin
MTFNNFDLNAKYALTSKFGVGVAYTYTDGHLGNGAATHYGLDPKWHQVNFQTVYSLSKRTDLYAETMYQHVIGHNFVAFINTSGGASSTANQFVATLGMRSRF